MVARLKLHRAAARAASWRGNEAVEAIALNRAVTAELTERVFEERESPSAVSERTLPGVSAFRCEPMVRLKRVIDGQRHPHP